VPIVVLLFAALAFASSTPVEYRATEYGLQFDNNAKATNRDDFIAAFNKALVELAADKTLSFHLEVNPSKASGEYKEMLTFDTVDSALGSRGGQLHVRNYPSSNSAECILKFETPDPNLITDSWCPVFPTTSHKSWATELKLEQNLFIDAHGEPIITEYWQRSPKIVATPADFSGRFNKVKDVTDLFPGAKEFYGLSSGSTPVGIVGVEYMWDYWGIEFSIGKSSPTVLKGGLQFNYASQADAVSGKVAPLEFEFTFRVKQPAGGWDDKVLARSVELLSYIENALNN